MPDDRVPPALAQEIEALPIEAALPLIISDADEVLFAFMAAFEAFLQETGHYFDWSSFALNGNIRRRFDSAPAGHDDIVSLLSDFFVARAAAIEPVPGAAESLRLLSGRAQIVVLSNIPTDQAPARREAMVRSGMDYPLLANRGPKGPAVNALADQVDAPVFFIDDGANHHASVAAHAAHVFRVHMIADARLAKLVEQAPHSHRRADDWDSARALIEEELTARGY